MLCRESYVYVPGLISLASFHFLLHSTHIRGISLMWKAEGGRDSHVAIGQLPAIPIAIRI